ncbi:SDR family NAD(P)-dependent oxidoreductase [Thermoleophilum album]|uniref:Short-chain dehydrogenase n=1 Tax=Thermoleophilum album TaxID=29539 RepID=A0A1H6FUU8_THEAL|nr:SDR family oxidoreductase [Thermoleophilum album]SEH14192.1 Short-chain dehydrogenase [Thermoleophilum album]
MPERAALVTGGSSGIGFDIARALGEDGYALTISARKPDKLEEAARTLRDAGLEVHAVAANMAEEEDIKRVAREHRERYGRLDVLVNNAGVGIAGPIEQTDTKRLDIQLDVNLRAVYLMTRECIPLLKQAGAEHRRAHIINTASIAGKIPQPGLAAYSAAKAGVVALTQATIRELSNEGVRATALCPGFVATPMTEWIKEHVPESEMIQTSDIVAAVRFLLSCSPNCIVPEIQFVRPGDMP